MKLIKIIKYTGIQLEYTLVPQYRNSAYNTTFSKSSVAFLDAGPDSEIWRGSFGWGLTGKPC